MTGQTRLESRYRRWLVWYPKSFRRDHDAELLAVLVAVSREGQRHPSPGELFALVRGGLAMRLLPDLPRSARLLRTAIGLLCLGAALEVATWLAVIATRNSVAASLGLRTGILARLALDLVAAPVVVIALLLLAWAIGHGRRWGRGGLVALVLLTTIGFLTAVSQGAASYAPIDVIVDGLAWLTTLVATVLVLSAASKVRFAA
ncbi:MAG TPA: hypothetical protein VHV74_09785 [Pseudonocardiaceae bacterium]|nr:hypothetical protein [Pseudonocardiaceae bacterium]